MEFIIDTVDLEEIRDAVDHLPIVGVTSNPSIVKKTSPKDFFGHMREIRKSLVMNVLYIFRSLRQKQMKL